jgi:hypothetical protein
MIPGSLTELLTYERTVLHIIQIYANQKFSIHKKNLNKLAGTSQKKNLFWSAHNYMDSLELVDYQKP